MKSKYYNRIMNLRGAEDIKKLVQKWDILSQNIGEIDFDCPILLPDYLLITPHGSGKNHILHLIADYLDDVRLMNFQGDTKVINFQLEYCKPDSSFPELNRLAETIMHAKGFHDQFQGILSIDCSEWIHHFGEKYMSILLEYLRDNSNEWLIFVVINSNDKKQIPYIENIMSKYLRFHSLRLPYPSTDDMVAYMEDHIKRYGIVCTEDAKLLLHDTIETIRNNKSFSGFNTLDLFVQEILYMLYSEKENVTKEITAEMLSPFLVDGSYTRKMIDQIQKPNHPFGF